MSRGYVWLSDAAVVDIVEQADWFEQRSGRHLARRWEDEVEVALIRIERNPGSGARCGFRVKELQDIRRMPIEGFPKHLTLNREELSAIRVLRVVHGARDLDSLF